MHAFFMSPLQSIRVSFRPSVRLSICLSVHPSILPTYHLTSSNVSLLPPKKFIEKKTSETIRMTWSLAPSHKTPNSFSYCLASHWLTSGFLTMAKSPLASWQVFLASFQVFFSACKSKTCPGTPQYPVRRNCPEFKWSISKWPISNACTVEHR